MVGRCWFQRSVKEKQGLKRKTRKASAYTQTRQPQKGSPPTSPPLWDSSMFAGHGIRRVFPCADSSGVFTPVWLVPEGLSRNFFITWSGCTTPDWISCRSKWANVGLLISLRILLRLPILNDYSSSGSCSLQILLKGLLVLFAVLLMLSLPNLGVMLDRTSFGMWTFHMVRYVSLYFLYCVVMIETGCHYR